MARRELEHRADKELGHLKFEAVHHTDNYAAQRGLEHILYLEHEVKVAKASGGFNRIRAMSERTLKSAKGKKYLEAAAEHLKSNP